MRNKAASGVATRGNNVAAVIAQLLTKVLPSASRSPPSASESASDARSPHAPPPQLTPRAPPPAVARAPNRPLAFRVRGREKQHHLRDSPPIAFPSAARAARPAARASAARRPSCSPPLTPQPGQRLAASPEQLALLHRRPSPPGRNGRPRGFSRPPTNTASRAVASGRGSGCRMPQ